MQIQDHILVLLRKLVAILRSPEVPTAMGEVASVRRPATKGRIVGIIWSTLVVSMLIMAKLSMSLFRREDITVCVYSAPPAAPKPN